MADEAWKVRFVHKISPRDNDVDVVSLPAGAFSNRNTLGAALRAAGLLFSGERIREFRVEGDKVIAFPAGSIWHSIILTSEG
jgi:hypothetical protein